MYECPIDVIMHDLPNRIIRNEENVIAVEIQKQLEVKVDNAELMKALAYDRNQYEKGFEDAKKKFERPRGEWEMRLNEETGVTGWHCSRCGFARGQVYISFCGQCGADMREWN